MNSQAALIYDTVKGMESLSAHCPSSHFPHYPRWFPSADVVRINAEKHATLTPGEQGYRTASRMFPCHPHYNTSKLFLGKPNKAVGIYQVPQWHGTNPSTLLSNEMSWPIHHWKPLSLRKESKCGGWKPGNSSYPINHRKTQHGYVI